MRHYHRVVYYMLASLSIMIFGKPRFVNPVQILEHTIFSKTYSIIDWCGFFQRAIHYCVMD